MTTVYLFHLRLLHSLNSLRPRLNRRPFTDDIFKCIFLNENEWALPRISLKFVPKVRINNIPVLVQIMAWRRPGDKPLSEPMMASFLTHICVTRPQWVNLNPFCILTSQVTLASVQSQQEPAGARFNIKMSSYQYRKSHCGDKTVVRLSYLHNGISYAGKMSSFYWIRVLQFGICNT